MMRVDLKRRFWSSSLSLHLFIYTESFSKIILTSFISHEWSSVPPHQSPKCSLKSLQMQIVIVNSWRGLHGFSCIQMIGKWLVFLFQKTLTYSVHCLFAKWGVIKDMEGFEMMDYLSTTLCRFIVQYIYIYIYIVYLFNYLLIQGIF